jgi:hypothetical protein
MVVGSAVMLPTEKQVKEKKCASALLLESCACAWEMFLPTKEPYWAISFSIEFIIFMSQCSLLTCNQHLPFQPPHFLKPPTQSRSLATATTKSKSHLLRASYLCELLWQRFTILP